MANDAPVHPLFLKPCRFVLGVADLSQLPETALPEVAFAGRSNVGKSSLINALTNNSRLAHTSKTPGRTQQLNFFRLDDRLHIVDMPGYGFAKVSKEQKDAWHKLLRDYLRGRPNLRVVFVLVDARHGLKESDREIMDMLDVSAVPYRIVLTKADKTTPAEKTALLSALVPELKKRKAAFPEPLLTSSHEKSGLFELQGLIASMAE